MKNPFKPLGKKEAESLYWLIRNAAKSATFENASFGMDKVETQKVKDLTKIYRQTWIIDPLQKAIMKLKENYNF